MSAVSERAHTDHRWVPLTFFCSSLFCVFAVLGSAVYRKITSQIVISSAGDGIWDMCIAEMRTKRNETEWKKMSGKQKDEPNVMFAVYKLCPRTLILHHPYGTNTLRERCRRKREEKKNSLAMLMRFFHLLCCRCLCFCFLFLFVRSVA